jgi:hypothetical protein
VAAAKIDAVNRKQRDQIETRRGADALAEIDSGLVSRRSLTIANMLPGIGCFIELQAVI